MGIIYLLFYFILFFKISVQFHVHACNFFSVDILCLN